MKNIIIWDLSTTMEFSRLICTKLSETDASECILTYPDTVIKITRNAIPDLIEYLDDGEKVILAVYYEKKEDVKVYDEIMKIFEKTSEMLPLIIISRNPERLKFFISRTIICSVLFSIEIETIKFKDRFRENPYLFIEELLKKSSRIRGNTYVENFVEELRYCKKYVKQRLIEKVKRREGVTIIDRIIFIASMSYLFRFRNPALNFLTNFTALILIYLVVIALSPYMYFLNLLIHTFLAPVSSLISAKQVEEWIIKPLMSFIAYVLILQLLSEMRKMRATKK